MPTDGRPVRTVLFDLDGTLADTPYVHVVCWWQALLQHEHLVPMARIHRAVGLGADKIVGYLLGDDRDRSLDAQIVAAHATLFTVWYDRARPLPGAADLLRWCSAAGLDVVLATSASEQDLEALMGRIDADEAVTARVTSADADRSKPDPDILEVALGRVDGHAETAVYIGDAVWDMMAAQRLGMRCIGLQSGGVSEAELRTAGASEVWQDPQDVLDHIDVSALTPR